jgi:hypothetical protein
MTNRLRSQLDESSVAGQCLMQTGAFVIPSVLKGTIGCPKRRIGATRTFMRLGSHDGPSASLLRIFGSFFRYGSQASLLLTTPHFRYSKFYQFQ